MLYRIVTKSEAGWKTIDLQQENVGDFVEKMEALGYSYNGPSQNKFLRDEIKGKPTFSELAGPMYDGPGVIRYECWAAYETLSN